MCRRNFAISWHSWKRKRLAFATATRAGRIFEGSSGLIICPNGLCEFGNIPRTPRMFFCGLTIANGKRDFPAAIEHNFDAEQLLLRIPRDYSSAFDLRCGAHTLDTGMLAFGVEPQEQDADPVCYLSICRAFAAMFTNGSTRLRHKSKRKYKQCPLELTTLRTAKEFLLCLRPTVRIKIGSEPKLSPAPTRRQLSIALQMML
jgi:hypothetical protein